MKDVTKPPFVTSTTVLKIGEVKPELTPEEHDLLVANYAKENPVKYAKKLAQGEFKKERNRLANIQKARKEEAEQLGALMKKVENPKIAEALLAAERRIVELENKNKALAETKK